jgi:hypothetical protein
MNETPEARLQRQRGEHYRAVNLAQRKRRYRHDDEYREKRKALSRAYYARITGRA